MAKPKGGARPGAGRPRIPIDWDVAGKLATMHCTGEEIAWYLQISYDTLERACPKEQGVEFAEWMLQKRAHGKASLRRTMYLKAIENKDTTMLIWLSKQHLGMSDKVESKETLRIEEKVYVAEWGGTKEVADREDET
jgi:hypothetical protein